MKHTQQFNEAIGKEIMFWPWSGDEKVLWRLKHRPSRREEDMQAASALVVFLPQARGAGVLLLHELVRNVEELVEGDELHP